MDPLKLTPSRCKLQEGVSGHYSKTVLSKKSITMLQVDSVQLSNIIMFDKPTHLYVSRKIKGKERRDID
jgi:hypothetical protein